MNVTPIAILGGTGFVGRHLVNRLTKEGLSMRVLTRRRERHRDLLVIPTLDLIEADVHDVEVLVRETRGCRVLINLVGILNERGDDGRGFRHAHFELAQKSVDACQRNGILRLLHMSALNAAPAGPSHYLRSKGEAEDLVHAARTQGLQVTSFRPSVIFGPDDGLFNRFATLLRVAPWLFPLACPNALFAPVYVGDVVEAFARALHDPATVGRRYDLCGPRVYTLQALVEYTAQCLHLKRRVIGLNEHLSRLQAGILERVPGKPMSLDNYRSLSVPSVCTEHNGLHTLGIEPLALETIVPAYLQQRHQRGRYQGLRGSARRR
ncbi:MAG: complex I NDUFA9 subunit family protein [Gammaproteobacteria bacterium]